MTRFHKLKNPTPAEKAEHWLWLKEWEAKDGLKHHADNPLVRNSRRLKHGARARFEISLEDGARRWEVVKES
jgi:hypothetical protein